MDGFCTISDGDAERDVRITRERDNEIERKREKYKKKRKRDRERGMETGADHSRKLNNQTFPQGSRGLLWKPTPGRAMAMAVK